MESQMKTLRKRIRKIIIDSLDIDLEKDDVILTGKFKNKRRIVKDIGKDDLGQPTVNDRSALKFRIEKDLPKEKWSKKSKEELEELQKENKKATRNRLKKIIREILEG